MLIVRKITKDNFLFAFSNDCEDLFLLPVFSISLITKDICESVKAILEIKFVWIKFTFRFHIIFYKNQKNVSRFQIND